MFILSKLWGSLQTCPYDSRIYYEQITGLQDYTLKYAPRRSGGE